ncbi:hypothetical protein SteCoe_29264 [Stentor coeruleus]|uniref:EF-hand domain-containing protein n=1 Tax=Stentor coeruleus TaxID=5963 RepID=A0A1R2B6C3_9CILI|nr:hypothetical protein SteCoe_29264 [Stentor coeruleus]
MTVLGQESDGSIFDVMDDTELSEEETTELEANIEETEVLTTEEIEEEVTEEVTLEELQVENSALILQQEELEEQLADAQEKLDAYLEDIAEVDSDLQEKVTNLDDYNHKIIRAKLKEQAEADALAEAAEDSEESEEDEEDEEALSTSMIIIISLGFMFLLLHGVRSLLGFTILSFLNPAFYSLFVDVAILLFICAIVSIGYYSDFLEDNHLDHSVIIIGSAVFTFFWLLLGLWLIIAAQAFSQTWIHHEKSCQDLRNLTHIYQEAQIDLAEGVIPRRLKSIYKDFHYAIMRQLFICPTFLPPVTEVYLRTDFNLAEYLSRCLADVIDKVFQLNWLGYTFIIIAMIAWRFVVAMDEGAQFIALWVLPGLVLFLSIILIFKLRSVYNQLVPLPTDQIILNLPRDNFGRPPDMNEDIIPRPGYLSGYFHSYDKEANYINCCFYKIHPLKLTWSYIISKTFPNRHELLFWGDKYGVDIIIGFLQGISICLTLWITVILLHFIPILHEQWEIYGICMIVACILIWLFAACYLLPEIIRLVTLTSKIEMMKDRKIVEDSILCDRVDKAKVIVRIYRQFKMIYREKYGEKPELKDQVIENYAKEVFNLYKDQENQTVDVEELEDMIALCGVKLEDDELRLFAKECKPEGNQNITCQGFCNAVMTIMASRKLRPEFVVRVVLTRHFQEGRGKNVQDASIEEIKQFFNDFYWHFTEDDIQDFLWETRFVLEDIGTAEISELSGLVRNNVNDYAR